MFEVMLAAGSPLVGKTPAQATEDGLLAKGLLIVLLKRERQTLVPSGHITLAAGDHLTVFSQEPVREAHLTVFSG